MIVHFPKLRARALTFSVCLLLISASPSARITAQVNLSFERDRGRGMLKVIKDDIKKNYHDPAYRGLDIEAHFKSAEEALNQAQSIGQIFGIIAQALMKFDDSHTFFIPPSLVSRYEYGMQIQAIGERCYVTAVKPGGDAEAKGVKPGDAILSIGGYNTTRDSMWKLTYLFYTLRPVPGLPITVVSPDGSRRQLEIMAKVTTGKRLVNFSGVGDGGDIWEYIRELEAESRLSANRYVEVGGNELFIWKMPDFVMSDSAATDMMNKAGKFKSLILDLRGNGGGAVKTLELLTGHFFDKDLKIADLKGRKEMKPITAKTQGNRVFKGKLVVLVDSKSGSAAEIFARVIQLEKRGVVIGDRTAGAVMQARYFPHEIGAEPVVFFGASVTNADVIAPDGKSLERIGVSPDELLLPSAADLAAKRDPVLTRAAAMVEVELSPEKAGAMFPIEWRK